MDNAKSKNSNVNPDFLAKYNINKRRALFTLILSIFVDVLGYSMVFPLLPRIAQEFGASDFIIGLLISSNAFAALIFGPIWGKLSDRYGRKSMLIIAQSGTLAAFLILGFSVSLPMIFFSRIIDGIFGGQMPILRAYVADITSPETRASEMGKLTIGFSTGMIFGPSIGGFLGELNWRYPAFLASGIAIIAMILSWRVLVESMPKERREDLKKSFQNNDEDNGTKRSMWSKELLIRLIQLFFAFFITGLLNSSLSLIMDRRYNAGPAEIGLIMTIAGFCSIFYGGFLLKRLIRWIGEKRLLIFSISLLIVLFVLIPLLFEFWMVFVFVVPYALCMAINPALIQTNITRAVDPDKQGTASGWGTNTMSLSQSISPLLSTYFLQIGGISIGFIYLDSYQLIGYFGALVGVVLMTVILIDFKLHPNLISKSPTNYEK